MYDFLSKYLMSEDDLVQNGYPRPCPTAPGRAVFKTKKEPSKDRKCSEPSFAQLQNRYNMLIILISVLRKTLQPAFSLASYF